MSKYLAVFDHLCEYENGCAWGIGYMENDSLDELKRELMLASVYTGNFNDTYYDNISDIKIYELSETIHADELPGREQRIMEINKKNEEEKQRRLKDYEDQRRAEYEKLRYEFEGKE